MPGLAGERQPVVEQRGEAAHDREPEAHARRARLVGPPRHLVELVEHALAMLGRDADPAVDDLDRDARAAAPRADHDAAAARVAERVGDEVAQHALEKQRIRVDGEARAAPRQRERARARLGGELALEALEQRHQRHALALRRPARRPRGATGRSAARTAPRGRRARRARSRPAARARRRARCRASAATNSPSACSGWRRSWLAAASSWLLPRFADSAAARALDGRRASRLELADQVALRWRVASASVSTSLSRWPNASTNPSTTAITTAVYRCTGPPSAPTRAISGTSAGSTKP
jgi:hypothetical protein